MISDLKLRLNKERKEDISKIWIYYELIQPEVLTTEKVHL